MDAASVSAEPFGTADVGTFLRLALAEGWICDRWELDFLRGEFPAGCLVIREGGRAIAFVTAIRYERSGWIGNLLVHKRQRGRGLGTLLMATALGALVTAGTETVWLTASADGRPVYERLDFVPVDCIRRWRGRGDVRDDSPTGAADLDDVIRRDGAAWGDKRASILRTVAEQGRVVADGRGFLVVQRGAAGIQLGPWSCDDAPAAAALLTAALDLVGGGREVFLDVPSANGAATALLRERGFAPCGETLLMWRGRRPDYRPELVYALASMGSMG
jgi:ribosomal protein S18 acetylase RimI-like enzyme